MGVDHSGLKQLAEKLNSLSEEFPDIRRETVNEMSETLKQELSAQIISQGVNDSNGFVKSWQVSRVGSLGGYAAISPGRFNAVKSSDGRVHTFKGNPVSATQVTAFLINGHKTRKPMFFNSTAQFLKSSKSVQQFPFYQETENQADAIAQQAAENILAQLDVKMKE